MDAKGITDGVVADMRRGWGVSLTDLVIAALVVLPFTGAFAILIGTMTGMPDVLLVILTGVLQGAATFWNAGWRARTGE